MKSNTTGIDMLGFFMRWALQFKTSPSYQTTQSCCYKDLVRQ